RHEQDCKGDAGEMQNFTVFRRKWRNVLLLGLLAGVGAVLAASSFTDPIMLMPLTGWALLVGRALWHASRSLASGNVDFVWDEQRLFISPFQGEVAVEIAAATWVYSDGRNIV